MTVKMHDIRSRVNTPKQREPIKGINFSDISYADDTLVFGTYTPHLNEALKEIEIESAYYNMNLNYDKNINLTLNRVQSKIVYKDTTLVPRKPQATYLGAILTDTNDNHAEINNRMAGSMQTANRMKLFWNKANTASKWKIQVYDAIIRSKLLYGLETIQLTQPDINRMDAFHVRGLRRILRIPPTFEDRTWTNEKVFDKRQWNVEK